MPPHAMWNVSICTCPMNAFSCWPFTHGSMSRWSQTFLKRTEHSQVKSLTSKFCDAQFSTNFSQQSQKSAWCSFKRTWRMSSIWFYISCFCQLIWLVLYMESLKTSKWAPGHQADKWLGGLFSPKKRVHGTGRPGQSPGTNSLYHVFIFRRRCFWQIFAKN